MTDLQFETAELPYGALSPAHFWAHLRRDSGAMLLATDALEAGTLEVVEAELSDVLATYFDEERKSVRFECRLVTGTVA